MNSGSITLGTLTNVMDEDIVLLNNGAWSMLFDASDVGVTRDVDAFAFLDADSILLSFDTDGSIPGVSGTVTETDIVRFDATSLGANTAGAFSLYFDGDDVGLTTSGEDIDALELLSDGRILISTLNAVDVPNLSGEADEDVLAFTPTTLGSSTSGTWAFYFDGSDVSLTSGEDVDGFAVASNGRLYLSDVGAFAVPGLSGANEDVFTCTPGTLGPTTTCTYQTTLAFDGSAWGLAGDDVDGVDIP